MDEKRRRVPVIGARNWTTAYQKDWTTNPDLGVITEGVTSPIAYVQTTQSRGHAWPSAKRANKDIGGNFTTAKVDSLVFDDGVFTGRSHGHYYKGQELPYNPGSAIQEALNFVTPSTDIVLMQKGTTAIARCIPTNPVADAGTFVGELKSGLPRLVGKELFKTKFKDYRKYGSEYINVEFGLKPIISDLQKFAKATIESEKILKQLEQDSGKNVRRKHTFPIEIVNGSNTTNSRVAYTSGLNLYPYVFRSATGGPLLATWNVTTETWFSGCFTYYLNLGSSSSDKLMRAAAEARKLYGAELTPATVWNLAPWSWAVDWEGNIGDALSNVSRFSQDGLVMRYGYIMQKKTAKVDYRLHPNGRLNGAPNAATTMSVTVSSRTRRRATPFGFGFDMTALTGRQLSILGALGISRGPRHL